MNRPPPGIPAHGAAGAATVLYALAIGPPAQVFPRGFAVPDRAPRRGGRIRRGTGEPPIAASPSSAGPLRVGDGTEAAAILPE